MDREEDRIMRNIGIVILLLFPAILHAEHLFEMGLHGGLTGWNGKTEYIESRIGFQGGAHLYYDYFSPDIIGFRTGVTIDCHNASLSKTKYEDSYSVIDAEDEQMDIRYSINELKERYMIYSVGIPLQLALTIKGLHLFAGAKVVFPFANNWNQSVRHAALAVYYPKYDNIIEESYPLAASRDFTMDNSGHLALPNIQWWFTAELSYTIPINTWSRRYRSYIMVGTYFDYCFTRYTPSHSDAVSLIMLSDTRDGFPLQRVLTPVMEANRQGRKLVTDGALFDVGIKISYAITPYNPHRRSSHSCNCL